MRVYVGQPGRRSRGDRGRRLQRLRRFRDAVANLEDGGWGSSYPTLMNHSDSEGAWTVEVLPALIGELGAIKSQFEQLPPRPFPGGWQAEVAAEVGLTPRNLHESFIDVNGDTLVDRLIDLAATAVAHQRSIEFQ